MNKEQKPEAHRLAEKLSNAYDFADDIDHNDLKLAAMELESLHARVQELETLAAPLNIWQQAIDAELVSAHLGVATNDATFEGAQKAIHELICWHIDVATNPATNGGQRLTDAKPIVWPVAMPEPVAAQVRFKPENDTTWSRWKVCAVEDAREIEAYTLVNGWGYEVRYIYTEQQMRELLARDIGASPPPQADALDAELLNFLQDQSIDLRCFNSSDGEDVGWRTVQHHMSEPRERVVSEVYGDQPRRAIREAMARIERDPYCTGPLHLEDDAAIAAAKENK